MRADQMPTSPDPIAQVTSGMRVVDSAGDEVGTVADVRTGDPNAVAAQEPAHGHGVLGARIPHTEAGDEPHLPADLAAHLLRTGYVKVDGHGLLTRELYVEAGQIADVRADVVELTVPASELAHRS
ncbi:MAG TPA: hypothetical protein VGD43_16815 [Micromonospora sp.]